MQTVERTIVCINRMLHCSMKMKLDGLIGVI